jgi:hypothetical protein
MKITAFWNKAPCSLVEEGRRYVGAHCLHRPDDAGSAHIWNVGPFQRDYTALYSRRLSSLHSPLWESEISQIIPRFNSANTN